MMLEQVIVGGGCCWCGYVVVIGWSGRRHGGRGWNKALLTNIIDRLVAEQLRLSSSNRMKVMLLLLLVKMML